MVATRVVCSQKHESALQGIAEQIKTVYHLF